MPAYLAPQRVSPVSGQARKVKESTLPGALGDSSQTDSTRRVSGEAVDFFSAKVLTKLEISIYNEFLWSRFVT